MVFHHIIRAAIVIMSIRSFNVDAQSNVLKDLSVSSNEKSFLRAISSLTQSRSSSQERQFRVVYEWKSIDFAYENDYDRGSARKTGDYIERNIFISDIKAFANRLYLALPRMLPGVPATLGWIISPDNNGRTDPLIEPFPSWNMNKQGNCKSLQFVQGIEIDGDGILWALDSGRLHTAAAGNAATCSPKLILFDLKRNGSIIHVHEFPNEIVNYSLNFLNKIVIDNAYGGYAYITDNNGLDPGIVVYSRKLRRSWKIREPNSMRADPNAMDFTINGTLLRFSIHIDGIALGPYINLGSTNFERYVYYSPLSSYHLYSIPASILRDPEISKHSRVSEFVTDYGIKISQTDGMIMDNHGNLYYGLLKEHAIGIWNCFQPFTIENQHILAKDEYNIQWVDGMSFDENGYLYVIVNRLFNFVAGRLNTNDVNFRILRVKTNFVGYINTNGAGDLSQNYNSPSETMLLHQYQSLYFDTSTRNVPHILLYIYFFVFIFLSN